ncbi:hypothetical protein [Azospirillum canadense]|uniref:hypothetical protein n=1 Tax=Azospirillum canadense TaxID=403962 RepID=UPI002225D25E|nr:hypothetical protein [Azospirillum canadense]MCW2240970.1 hypothetical protein [Azospirillum canadense]
MKAVSFSDDVLEAATVHLGVLDDFIAIAQTKLNETPNVFARDSLSDLLASLREQRDSYAAFALPVTMAA